MKLLFVSSHLSPMNGWGKVAVEMIDRFANDGHEVVVLTDDKCDFCVENCRLIRKKIMYSKSGGRSRQWRILRDRFQCRDLNPRDFDAVFCLTEDLLPFCASLAKGKTALLCFAYGTYAIKTMRGRSRGLYLDAFQACKVIFCISEYTMRQLDEVSNGAFKDKMTLALLGCTPVLSESQYEATLGSRKNQIVAVGQLKPRKAVLESVRAFSSFLIDSPGYEFHVIGDLSQADYVQQIKDLVSELGLQDHVLLVGRQSADKLTEYYRTSKLLLMPTINENDHFEGFGLVHLEANSMGTPTIGSFDCGHEDAVRDSVSGILTPQGDIKAIANAMRTILSDEESWGVFSKGAYQHSGTMTWDETYQRCVERVQHALSAEN